MGRRRFGSVAVAAVLPSLLALGLSPLLPIPEPFNDFHDYWLAGRIVAGGGNPYDIGALTALARSLGETFLVGSGYSYPVPFAIAMVPLSRLPIDVATAAFIGLSLAFLGLTVAWWLPRVLPGLGGRASLAAAALVGAYPPVVGSVLVGQANLLVLGLLGIALAPFADRVAPLPERERPGPRELGAGVALGLATVVKLVPAAILVPLALAWGRDRRVRAVGVTAIVSATTALALAAVVAPLATGGSGALGALFGPDPYWTNQSINGLVSRLFLATDQTAPILAGDPRPWVVAATALLAVVTAALTWRARARVHEPGALALLVAFALVAATAGAPKTSFWNHALVLPGVALVVGQVPGWGRDLRTRLLVLAWLAGAVVEAAVGWTAGPLDGPLAAVRNVAGSASLLGLLGLWLALALPLRAREPPAVRTVRPGGESLPGQEPAGPVD